MEELAHDAVDGAPDVLPLLLGELRQAMLQRRELALGDRLVPVLQLGDGRAELAM